MKKHSILLVDDHAVVRQGLKALIQAEPDMEVVGEAEDGRQAIVLARKLSPDMIIMDLAMPTMNGLTATRNIFKALPDVKVLVLSSYSDDECVKEMMDAGACGFLMKQTAATELLQAIRLARKSQPYFSPVIARRLRNQRPGAFNTGRFPEEGEDLTARELEVLKLIAEGLSNREIATHLDISIKTVEKHRQQTMNKLNIHEVAGLTRYALSKCIVERKVPVSA